MSIPLKWKTHQEARENKWFSRRHQTNKELEEARARRQTKKAIKPL